MAADWEELEKKHNENVAVMALKQAELEEKKTSIEKIIHDESLKVIHGSPAPEKIYSVGGNSDIFFNS